jgi:hypothetical protein
LLLGLNDDMLEKSCGVVRQVSFPPAVAASLSPPPPPLSLSRARSLSSALGRTGDECAVLPALPLLLGIRLLNNISCSHPLCPDQRAHPCHRVLLACLIWVALTADAHTCLLLHHNRVLRWID